jgi:hypothetical protein
VQELSSLREEIAQYRGVKESRGMEEESRGMEEGWEEGRLCSYLPSLSPLPPSEGGEEGEEHGFIDEDANTLTFYRVRPRDAGVGGETADIQLSAVLVDEFLTPIPRPAVRELL